MKKIYAIALAVFAFGTLSAQTTNQQELTNKKRKTAAQSISQPIYKQTTKQQDKNAKANANELKAIETKKKSKKESK